ncbi:MAG TPA: MBL fold metallo-hydrolase [bacterium]|nr:MBL fold metallo-hydrolase [bacterium]
MSEPDTVAEEITSIGPGLLHWTLHDNRINHRSDSYAVEGADGLVVIDPLPVKEELTSTFEDAVAICLTGRFHQRSAWRYQQQFEIPVYAPRKGQGYEGQPDHLYDANDTLPGELQVLHAPGPTDAHYVFLWESEAVSALFCADLLERSTEEDVFKFVPAQYQDEPEKTRESVRQLLNYEIDMLCPNHGAYVRGDVHAALREALEKDNEL